MPLGRRGTNAAAAGALQQRNIAMRVLLYSPKDMVAGLLAFAGVSAIVANAMFMQTGRHPAPMYGGASVEASATANPLPRPRPVELVAKPPEAKAVDVRAFEPKPVEYKAADPVARAAKTPAAPSVTASTIARPPAPIPVSA